MLKSLSFVSVVLSCLVVASCKDVLLGSDPADAAGAGGMEAEKDAPTAGTVKDGSAATTGGSLQTGGAGGGVAGSGGVATAAGSGGVAGTGGTGGMGRGGTTDTTSQHDGGACSTPGACGEECDANSCTRSDAGCSGGACPTDAAADVQRDAPAILMTPTLPAACTTDADCCVAMDDCLSVAYLVGTAEFSAMRESIANVNQHKTICASCINPSVQVECQNGLCVGETLPTKSTQSPLSASHCGFIDPLDGSTSRTAAPTPTVDSGAARVSWSCGD